jgi:hypothetical protein
MNGKRAREADAMREHGNIADGREREKRVMIISAGNG